MVNNLKKRYLFIHGAYHGAWCWDQVRKLVEENGMETYALDLPGHGQDNTSRKNVTIESYINKVYDFIYENELENLSIVGHSFAGVVITKLIERIPSRIRNIILISAVVLDNGEAFFDYFTEELRNKYIDKANMSNDNSIMPDHDGLKGKLFNDLNDDKVFEEVFRKLTPQPLTPYTEKVKLDNFKTTKIPVHYILCKKDIGLPESAFKKILSKLPDNYHKIEIDSDHEVMFSHPRELAKIIASI